MNKIKEIIQVLMSYPKNIMSQLLRYIDILKKKIGKIKVEAVPP